MQFLFGFVRVLVETLIYDLPKTELHRRFWTLGDLGGNGLQAKSEMVNSIGRSFSPRTP